MAEDAKQIQNAFSPATSPAGPRDDLIATWARIEQEDRQRLSAKVHNELQQFIAAARMHIGIAMPQGGAASGSHAEEILHLLDDCVEASRALTLDLFPRILHSGSFASAVEWLVKSIHARYAIQIKVQISTESQPQPHTAFAAFRAAHEALLNVAHHAAVREATVTLDAPGPRSIRIVVADSGAGLDPALLDARRPELHPSALQIARDRVLALGGTVQIRSSRGAGTTVAITVPAAAPLADAT